MDKLTWRSWQVWLAIVLAVGVLITLPCVTNWMGYRDGHTDGQLVAMQECWFDFYEGYAEGYKDGFSEGVCGDYQVILDGGNLPMPYRLHLRGEDGNLVVELLDDSSPVFPLGDVEEIGHWRITIRNWMLVDSFDIDAELERLLGLNRSAVGTVSILEDLLKKIDDVLMDLGLKSYWPYMLPGTSVPCPLDDVP